MSEKGMMSGSPTSSGDEPDGDEGGEDGGDLHEVAMDVISALKSGDDATAAKFLVELVDKCSAKGSMGPEEE